MRYKNADFVPFQPVVMTGIRDAWGRDSMGREGRARYNLIHQINWMYT